MEFKEIGWKVVGAAAAFAAAAATRSLLESGWRRARRADPPANPESPSTGWGEALTWAALTGMAVGIARMVAARSAAASWQRATGELPPGLEQIA